MNEERTVLSLLFEERERIAPSVPETLVRDILGIEERVQFDEDRREAVRKIATVVMAVLDKEPANRSVGGDAS